MMTASSTEFMNSLFSQTGTFIQDLWPLLLAGFGVVMAFVAFKIIVRAFNGPFKRLFK